MERLQSLYENEVKYNLSDSGNHPLSMNDLLSEEEISRILDMEIYYGYTTGDPKLLLMTTLRPLGPKVTLTASARAFTPRNIEARACSAKMISFALISMYLYFPLKKEVKKEVKMYKDRVKMIE